VPVCQPKRACLLLDDDSRVRLPSGQEDHVWSYDFVRHRTNDGRSFRMLYAVDELTREALAIWVKRWLSSTDVVEVMTDVFLLLGIPAHIRSDNGREFDDEAVWRWIAAVGACTTFTTSGSQWKKRLHREFRCAAARRPPQ